MAKLLEINKCEECPCCIFVPGREIFKLQSLHYCRIEMRGIEPKTIPNWCPLPDSEVKR
jgi:hypothetical protein